MPKATKSKTDTPKCPINKEQFRKLAPGVLTGTVDNQSILFEKKEFSSGSFGYYFSGKITLVIDGKPVRCQAGFNLTVIGSKDAEDTR